MSQQSLFLAQLLAVQNGMSHTRSEIDHILDVPLVSMRESQRLRTGADLQGRGMPQSCNKTAIQSERN